MTDKNYNTMSESRGFLICVLCVVSLISSLFYIFDSGTVQPSSVLLLLFAIAVFWHDFVGVRAIAKDKKILVLLSFLPYAASINLYYAISQSSCSYSVNTLYYVFDYIVFFGMCGYLLCHEKSRHFVSYTCFFGLVLLVGIWALGFGRYWFGSGAETGNMPRFNGYFNDPNQMAYWVLCVCAAIQLLLPHRLFIRIVSIVLAGLLISVSMSRSTSIGFAFVLASLALDGFRLALHRVNKRWLVVGLVAAACAIAVAVDVGWIADTFDRIAAIDVVAQAKARGFWRIVDYPQYLMFGAGQGGYSNYPTGGEIHSNYIGILFYYGVVGFVLLFGFLFACVRRLPLSSILIAAAPLAYGLTTFGLRTPIFWIFWACVYSQSFSETSAKAFVRGESP